MPHTPATPPAPQHHTHPPAAGLRGWRLAALVLAVLVTHGLLLAKWLQSSAGTTPTSIAADATPTGTTAVAMPMQVTARTPPASAPAASASAGVMAPPPHSPTVPSPPSPSPAPSGNPAATAQAASAPAVQTPRPTQAVRTQPAQANSSGEQNYKEKSTLSLSNKAKSAINSDNSITPTAMEDDRAPPQPDAHTVLSLAAPASPTEPLGPSAPAASGGEPTAPGLAATVPGKLRLPGTTTLSYEVRATRKGLSFPATGTLQFTRDGSAYDARMEIKALLVGSRTQTSKGLVDPAAGLQPVRFGDKAKSEQAAHFDRSRQPPVLRFSANTPDAPLQAHTQDRLSVLFQLAAMLAGEPKRFGAGSTVVVHTAGPRDADLWQFKVGKAEELTLPAGTLTAIHLVRTPTHAYDNRVEVWFAPSLGHLPVRVLWTQANGDVVDQSLSGHQP